MKLTSLLRTCALALPLLAAPALAQTNSVSIDGVTIDFSKGSNPQTPAEEAFFKAYTGAIEAQDEAAIRALYHPDAQSCFTGQYAAYGDYMVKKELNNHMTGERVVIFSHDPAVIEGFSLKDSAMTTQPIKSSIVLAVDWKEAKYKGGTVIRQLAEKDGKVYISPYCLTDKGLEMFTAKMNAEKARIESKPAP